MRIHHLALAALVATPLLAFGHPEHGAAASGFAAGFTHPFSGADHLAAMIAVGAWSALTLPRGRWLAPFCFAAMLLAGALLAPQGPQALVEPGIAASLLVLGLLVARRVRLPAAAGALLVGGFALFHGAAHGSELHGAAALLGMVGATALLHAVGLGLGGLLRASGRWSGVLAGGSVALLGVAMLAS
jgi:urease accessory protein